jgi:hypothetical protein
MLKKTAIALAAAASLALGGAALTPAMANYGYCTENPSATGCPGNYDVTKEQSYVAPHSYRGAEHQTRYSAHHHG